MASIKIDVDLGELNSDYTVVVTFKKSGEISALHYPNTGKTLVVDKGGEKPSPTPPPPSSVAEPPKKTPSSKKNMGGNMMDINI